MLSYPLDENLGALEKWLALKDLESAIKMELLALKEEVEAILEVEEVKEVSKVVKVSVKPKDSITKFLGDQGLLELVKKDGIDMTKVNQLVDAGVISVEDLEEHLERKESSYLKKAKVKDN